MKFGVLPQPVGLFNLMLNLFAQILLKGENSDIIL